MYSDNLEIGELYQLRAESLYVNVWNDVWEKKDTIDLVGELVAGDVFTVLEKDLEWTKILSTTGQLGWCRFRWCHLTVKLGYSSIVPR